MKLKLNADGSAVVVDGMPVYVHDNGSEVPFDAAAAIAKVETVNTEAKGHRLAKNELTEKLKLFEGIDPVKAKEAITIVSNLDDKKLVDAGEVDKLKTQMSGIFETEKTGLTAAFAEKEKAYKDEISLLNGNVRNMMITSKFGESPFFSGAKPLTNVHPEMASNFFGSNFKVEPGPDGKLEVFGYLKGEKIPSRKRIGEAADFEESIAVIIEASPLKETILKTNPGGPGGSGNLEDGEGGQRVVISSADARDVEKYRNAKNKARDAGIPLVIQE